MTLGKFSEHLIIPYVSISILIIIFRLTHDVEIVDSKIKLYQQKEALEKIKKLTVMKDPKSLENPGP